MPITTLTIDNKSFSFDPNKETDVLRLNGKFSSIYKGLSKPDNKPVVIKKLKRRHKFPESVLQKFKQEATITVEHPNVSITIGFTVYDGEYYLIREYVSGSDIQSFLKQRKLNKADKIKFIIHAGIEVLKGLAAIHNNNIIHCDIKPHNIIIEYNDINEVNINAPKIKLIDFGIARFKENKNNGKAPFSLIYSPPEQILNINDAINETTDLYSLAISMYELISEKRPFYNSNPELLMHLQLTQNLAPDKSIPDFIYHILLKATQKYKFSIPPNRYKNEELIKIFKAIQKDRFQTAIEFKEVLENTLSLL